MKKSVELPISKPLFNTYGFQTLPTAVLEQNPSIKNWVMNSLIFLQCNPNFLTGQGTSPEVFISNSGYQDCPYLERNSISLKFLGKSCHEVITAMLDDNCYVYYSNIDNSIIRKHYPYHGRLFSQSGIIFGYNHEHKTYSLLSCDENWNCQVLKIPQNWIELGRKKSLLSDISGTLCAIKPKSVTVNLDMKEIYQNLKSYIEHDLKTDAPYAATSKVCGTIVHTYVAMYLDYLCENIIPYKKADTSVFRQIWEHKKCMLERLVLVENSLKLDHRISDEYNKLVIQSKHLCEEYSAYCQKNDKKLLMMIRNQIVSIEKREQSLLSQFIVNMEGVIG